MKHVFRRIIEEHGIQKVDKDLVSVEEIFRLQGMDKVAQDERKFLR